jgi:hypothetical protein
MRLSILHLVGFILVALKLGAIIDWSWWLVLLPLYLGPLLVMIFVSVFLSIVLISLVLGAVVTALDYYLTAR